MQNPNIRISPLKMDDFHFVLNWSKDEVFCEANGWEPNRDEEELYKWWERCVNLTSDDFIRIGIEMNGCLIGYVDLACIQNKSAEIGIAIGERSLWGNGIGFHSTKLLLNYANEHLGISIFNAETHETNFRSIRMLEKLGFTEISREGSDYYLGEDVGLIQFQLLI